MKVQYPIAVCWRVKESLCNLWNKCKWIPGFNLLPSIENCIFVFRSIKALLASTRFNTIESSSKTVTITATRQVTLIHNRSASSGKPKASYLQFQTSRLLTIATLATITIIGSRCLLPRELKRTQCPLNIGIEKH